LLRKKKEKKEKTNIVQVDWSGPPYLNNWAWQKMWRNLKHWRLMCVGRVVPYKVKHLDLEKYSMFWLNGFKPYW